VRGLPGDHERLQRRTPRYLEAQRLVRVLRQKQAARGTRQLPGMRRPVEEARSSKKGKRGKFMKEKILEKIRKLFAAAKSEKSIGNEEFGGLLAEKAQELLDKYNLSLTDVEIEEERRSEVGFEFVSRSFILPVQRWQRHLLKVFADLSDCISIDNGFDLAIVGKESDRRIAIEFYKYFSELGNDLADIEMKSFTGTIRFQVMSSILGTSVETRRSSFLFGFSFRLGERLEENHRKAAADAPESESQALVLKNDKKRQVRAWAVENLGINLMPHPEMDSFDREAFHQGASMGERVALTKKTIE
jgi:hypothetical protein